MVKELEDAPRDEVAVVLDADPEAVVGESFDVQVRAAGSLLFSHVRRGRRAVLVVNGARAEQQGVRSAEGDWRQALDLLAAVEPEPGPPLAAVLADESSAVARSLELAVVTASLPPRLVERLVERALASGSVSLVFVDPSSFAGAAAAAGAGAAAAAGRGRARRGRCATGDDLAERLGGGARLEAAHG